jgi:hypothetical protein
LALRARNGFEYRLNLQNLQKEREKMVRKFIVATVAALLVVGMVAGMAFAAVTFDPVSGEGFVGKGDVQLVFGWNNKALQKNADSVQFQATSTVVSEVSWVCTNSNNENTQERARTTTTSVQGVVTTVARDNKFQITGFNLTGYSGTPTPSSSTEGPPLNSCPNNWTLTTPAGDPEVVSSSSTLQVSTGGTNWFDLQ